MKNFGVFKNIFFPVLRISLILLFFLFLNGCKKEVSQYSIPDDKWVDILSDIHVSEAASVQLSLSIRDSITAIYLEQIMVIHKIEREVFEAEFHQLKKDPEKLKVIYAEVISRLTDLKLKKKEKGKDKSKDKKSKISKK